MGIVIKNKSGDLLDIAWGNSPDKYNLSGANLIWANLIWADLREANLRGADLSRADLSGADLSGANLIWADLREADLREANLREADLREANLRGANLRGANLSGANLRGADLSGADLSGADLSGADLYFLGNCSRGYQYFLYFEDEPIIRAGCRRFTMPEARTHWDAAHADDPTLRAEILGKLDAAARIIAARGAAVALA